MRFAPLSVELIRARPQLVFWLVVLAQAALWFVLPVILYSSAPGHLGATLSVGHDYALVTPAGPPLAFWLADIAFCLAGNHLFGVYLLSQVCFVVAFWSLFALGREIVGAPQSVLAILLTAAITAFSFPLMEFGPDVLALPLWGLTLLNAWRLLHEGRRRAWIGLSFSAALLLMTNHAAPLLLGLLIAFMTATQRGRNLFRASDVWFALLLVAVLVFPYVLVQLRTNFPFASAIAGLKDVRAVMFHWSWSIVSVLLTLPGLALIAVASSQWMKSNGENPASIKRKSAVGYARSFVITFALAPVLIASTASAVMRSSSVIGGPGLLLMMAGLAVVLVSGDTIRLRRHTLVRALWLFVMAAPVAFVLFTSLVQPWFSREILVLLPTSLTVPQTK